MPRISNYDKVVRLFNPDKEGVSAWVSVDKFAGADLNWTNNGNARHGVFFKVPEFIWEKRQVSGSRSATTHLRTAGRNKKQAFNQNITAEVMDYFDQETLCSVSLLPVPKAAREIDHRYGNKTHPDYVAMYGAQKQSPKDFQLIFSVLNSAKRQICKECCESKVRPAHPTLGFVEGDHTHAARFPCTGCYLAEPERYRELAD